MKFNEKLRDLREDKDINQTELGKMLNVSQRRISRLEIGECYPTIPEIKGICRIFEVSADELLGIPPQEKKRH